MTACKTVHKIIVFLLVILMTVLLFQTVNAQTAKKLQIILPGMTASPGAENGYIGSPIEQTTGIPFNVIVNAVDDVGNIVSISDQVSLSSSDPLANLPLPVNLVNGIAVMPVTLNSGGLFDITAQNDDNLGIDSSTSPNVQVINIDYFAITPIGNPFEGVPGQVKAGADINNVEISARNNNGDLVSNYQGRVYLSELTDYGNGRISPEAVQLQNGKWNGKVKVFRAGEKKVSWGVTGDVWVKVSDEIPPPEYMEIIINCDDEYDMWINGEYVGSDVKWDTAQTYIVPRRTGKNVIAVHGKDRGNAAGLIAEIRVGGIVVYKTDQYWLKNNSYENDWTNLDFNDNSWTSVNILGEYGMEPWGKDIEDFPETSLANWVWGEDSDLYFRGTFYLEESSIPSLPLYTPHDGESNRLCAIPEDFSRLLTVLPGEIHKPGSIKGKDSQPLDQQSGVVFPVEIYATDSYWNQIDLISDVISLNSSDENAIIPANSNLSSGQMNMNITLNSPGLQTITASDVSDENILSNTSSNFTVLEGVNHFTFETISSQQIAGEPFQVTVTAVDQFGILVDNFNGTLDLLSSTGDQTISPVEISMSNGIWAGNVILTKAEAYVTLSVTERSNYPHSGTSNQFNVNAGETSRLQVLLPGETATPGLSPGKTGTVNEILAGNNLNVIVNAVDDWWNINPNSNDLVSLTSSDNSANLPSDASLSSGTKQFVVTLNSIGLQRITAFDKTNQQVEPGTSSEIRVNPGNLDQFVFNTINGSKTVGTPFSITITAVDLQENLVQAFAGLVSLSASTGDGTIVPVTANFHNGTWTGNITLKKSSGGVFISAYDNATPPHSGSSNEFEVKPGPITRFQVLVPGLTATPGVSPGYTGTPQAQNVGKPFPIIINGVDSYWNVATTANDSFGVSSTEAFASLPEPTKLNNGSRNLSVILNEDGSHTISAFHLSNQQIQNGQTPYINLIPQNLDHFTIEQINGPVAVGQSLQITIRAETNENEKVFSFNGNVNLSASTGTGTVIPEIVGSFVNGEWTGEVFLTRASNDVYLTASDEATPTHSGLSNQFSVLAGEFKRLQVLLPGENAQPGSIVGKTGKSSDQQTGVQFDIIVLAVDEYWNLVTNVTDSIKLLSSDQLAIFQGRNKLINGNTTISILMGSAGKHTITAEDISDRYKLAGISSLLNVNPGNLNHFVFQTISNQIAGNEFELNITATDVVGNPVAGFNGHARLQSTTGEETFSPTEIDFVDGAWSGKLSVTKAAENVQLTCLDFASTPHSGQSNTFNVEPGEFTKVQILLPGETATPGKSPGKTGEVGTQLAGDAVVVIVNAVDNWWNPVSSANGTIGLSSTDGNANLPLDANLNSGSVTFNDMRFMTAGHWTITAACKSNPQISSDTSPLIHVITGSIANFVFDSINSPQVVGDSIQISIRAVDGSGTTVSSYQEKASVTASTGPGTYFIDEVQFQDGIWNGQVVLTKAMQSVHLNVHDFADVVRGNSNPFTLIPGQFAKLQILLPGETAKPGLTQAKGGVPQTQTIGIPFQIKVLTTDAWWNQVKPDSLQIKFSSSDQMASLPEPTFHTSSSVDYTVTLLNVDENNITVQATNFPSLVDTSSTLTIQSGQIDHLVFSTIENNQKAGHPFSLRIEAYNQFNFLVTTFEGDIILSASTGNGTLSETGVTLTNGFWEGELFVTRADTQVVLYGADYVPAPETHTGYSNAFSVLPDTIAGLQVLIPGETCTPGVEPGKKGDRESHVAGSSPNILIRAVDSYWNLIKNRKDTLSITVTDSFAVYPEIITLQNGFVDIPITFRAAQNHQVTANFSNLTSFSTAKSDTLKVIPNVFTQLLMLMPGEQLLPGDNESDPLKTPGRFGDASVQTSSLPFTVEVLAVDEYWNLVPNVPSDKIQLFTTDNTAEITPIDSVLVNGKSTFTVTLSQGGNQVLRANNDSNSEIRSSLDGVVEIMVGGIHYEFQIVTNKIAAGEPFNMQLFYKDGLNQTINSANHLVHLSVVDANNVEQVLGSVQNGSFNLESGLKTIDQICNIVGIVKIKVEDEIGTQPAFSKALEIIAGAVSTINIEIPKEEIRGLEEIILTSALTDAAGNPVPNQEAQFQVISGSGTLKKTSATSTNEGMVTVGFVGGKSNETNIVRVQVDTVHSDIEIIVNLTQSSLANGIPINYPNPFGIESDVTYIDYYLEENAEVTLQIYDLFGNKVWTKKIEAGTPGGIGRENNNHPNTVIWTGINDRGQKVGNGGYILLARAVANGKTIMNAQRKIAVIR